MSLQSLLKGFLGEATGGLAARLFLDPEHYRALNNVTLQTGHGTVQIDHVIVSRFGIFVVETKHYQGWIFGAEQQPQWTQCLPGGRKFRFQNPLRQNYRHIKSLSGFLGLPEDRLHSVVMFWGDSEFKTPMPANVLSRNYATYIKSKTDRLFSDAADLAVSARVSRRASKKTPGTSDVTPAAGTTSTNTSTVGGTTRDPVSSNNLRAVTPQVTEPRADTVNGLAPADLRLRGDPRRATSGSLVRM